MKSYQAALPLHDEESVEPYAHLCGNINFFMEQRKGFKEECSCAYIEVQNWGKFVRVPVILSDRYDVEAHCASRLALFSCASDVEKLRVRFSEDLESIQCAWIT